MAPKKTEAVMPDVWWLDKSHSAWTTTAKKLNSRTSILSAAKHKPAARSMRFWNGPVPTRSMRGKIDNSHHHHYHHQHNVCMKG